MRHLQPGYRYRPLLPVAARVNNRAGRWEAIVATIDENDQPQLRWHYSTQDAPTSIVPVSWDDLATGLSLKSFALEPMVCTALDLRSCFEQCELKARVSPIIETFRLAPDRENTICVSRFRLSKTGMNLVDHYRYVPAPGRTLSSVPVGATRSATQCAIRDALEQLDRDPNVRIPLRASTDLFSLLPRRPIHERQFHTTIGELAF